ncbi:MAG TPA: hypothetical protein VIJ35_25865 [Bradyrhizobium sp.]
MRGNALAHSLLLVQLAARNAIVCFDSLLTQKTRLRMRANQARFASDRCICRGTSLEFPKRASPIAPYVLSLQFTAYRFASKKLAYFGVDSVFRSGAPGPMKMGTIHSLWRYDVEAYHPLQSERQRLRAILYCASEGRLLDLLQGVPQRLFQQRFLLDGAIDPEATLDQSVIVLDRLEIAGGHP